LVHWPLMGGLLHSVQRGGDWAGPQPTQSPPHCTKCNSPPINGQCINHRIACCIMLAVLMCPLKGQQNSAGQTCFRSFRSRRGYYFAKIRLQKRILTVMHYMNQLYSIQNKSTKTSTFHKQQISSNVTPLKLKTSNNEREKAIMSLKNSCVYISRKICQQ